MFPDGVAYLDMGEALLRGDWEVALNAYWSPLYSLLLGVALYFLKPSAYWEYPAVQLVNFLIYMGALACFSFFMKEFIRFRRQGTHSDESLPDWAWIALGYSLFIWSSLSLITISIATPDMLVAGLVYLSAAFLLRIRKGHGNWGAFAVLGVTLGFGYLSKSAMFPMMFVFLGTAILGAGSLRKGLPSALLALITFFLVAGPFIAALSITKGYLTLGDSGKLNYAWAIHRTTLIHWQGEHGDVNTGAPLHPTRKIHEWPPIYEFATPIRATYPPWYDPTYWFEGIAPRFEIKGQVKTLIFNLRRYDELLLTDVQCGLLVGLLTLILMSARKSWSWLQQMFSAWRLLVPSIVAFAMYTIVAIRPRYVAPFVVLLWLGLFFGARLRGKEWAAKMAGGVPVAIIVLIVILIIPTTLKDASAVTRELINGQNPATHRYWQVADGLSELGIRPGDHVAVIQSSRDYRAQPAFWARLARVRIVAEVTPAAVFLTSNAAEFWHEDSMRKVTEAFGKTGAKIIVSERAPGGIEMAGWQQIGNTDWFAFILQS